MNAGLSTATLTVFLALLSLVFIGFLVLIVLSSSPWQAMKIGMVLISILLLSVGSCEAPEPFQKPSSDQRGP